MRHTMLRRLAALALSLVMVLSLVACGAQGADPNNVPSIQKPLVSGNGDGDTPDTLPDDDLVLPEVQDISVPPVAQKALDDLEWLMDIAQMPTAAVAYMGHYDNVEDDYYWRLQECMNNAPYAASEFPFFTSIAPENIVGTQGDLFCILLHSDAKMTVHPLEWKTPGDTTTVIEGDPIFRMEDPVPVLVHVNFSNNGNDPDVVINITGSDGTEVKWFPMIDEETGGAVVPSHDEYSDMLLEFTNLGNYGTQEELLGAEDVWIVPTDEKLANSSWVSHNGWRLDLLLDTEGGESAMGAAAIYYTAEDEDGNYDFQLYANGTWWMSGEFLCLDVYDEYGTMVGGAYPVRLPLWSGELLYISRGEDSSAPSFFSDFGLGYMLLHPLYEYFDYYPLD